MENVSREYDLVERRENMSKLQCPSNIPGRHSITNNLRWEIVANMLQRWRVEYKLSFRCVTLRVV